MSNPAAPGAAQAQTRVASRHDAGTLFLVVGPSGAGKDSLIDGLRARLDPDRFVFARRTITREAGAPGEDHIACTQAEFEAARARGEFLITWQAHGLHYGLPGSIARALATGQHVIANGSRGVAGELAQTVPTLAVVEVDAPADVIAARLAARGREQGEDLQRRLSRPRIAYPAELPLLRVNNDRDLATGVLRMQAAMMGYLGEWPATLASLVRKLNGERLTESQWAALLAAIVDGQIPASDRDALLSACANDLDDAELVHVARWRSRLMPRVDWGREQVVDKHSMGGTAGSRVTMVVIPIVAAHGMLIPKTSSRAITSAAGTADAMEVLARVDLTPEQLRKVVREAGACIAWNGRLNHSVLDDAMHALERPLGLDTRRWSVASILSKKFSAGATNVVIDLPYAPGGKLKSREQAESLAAIFERLGAQLGMTVRAFPTDGSAPIGRGIGPALEVRDVLQVLACDPQAPADLRDKSLFFAARIIEMDPAVPGAREAEARARALLESGAARRAFETIIEAQGRRPAPDWSQVQQRAVRALQSGTVQQIDARAISAIARGAGAPADPLAGVDLVCRRGQSVARGDLLYWVQACDATRLEQAAEAAGRTPGIVIGH